MRCLEMRSVKRQDTTWDTPFQKFVWKRGQSCISLVTVKTKEDSIRYTDVF